MVIDGHAHLFRAMPSGYPRELAGDAQAGREERAEQLIENMALAGVHKAVIVPLSADDGYPGDVLAEYPGVFATVGVHDPDAANPAADLRRRIGEHGIQGLAVSRIGEPTSEVEALAIFPLLAAMADRNLKLIFFGDTTQLAVLNEILVLLPTLEVILNRLGLSPGDGAELYVDQHRRPRYRGARLPPPTHAAVERFARHRHAYVYFTGAYAFSAEAYPHRDLQSAVEAMYRMFGAHRMIWASDYPWTAEEPGYLEQLALLDRYLPGLPAAERAAIRGGTASSLFTF